MACAPSEDSDQPDQRMPRLIWVFAGRIVIMLVLSCGGLNTETFNPEEFRRAKGGFFCIGCAMYLLQSYCNFETLYDLHELLNLCVLAPLVINDMVGKTRIFKLLLNVYNGCDDNVIWYVISLFNFVRGCCVTSYVYHLCGVYPLFQGSNNPQEMQ